MGIQLIGASSGIGAEVAPNTRALLVTLRPTDYASFGSFRKALNSGTMAAGLAANSTIFSFRNGGVNLALVKRVGFVMAGLGTAFTAGQATFNMLAARSFTASDSGGTAGSLTGNVGKLRTSMAAPSISDIRIASTGALTAGTRTLDTDPLAAITVGIGATANVIYIPPTTDLFVAYPGDHPLVCAQNEGFIIQATVPATGTWCFGVQVEWDEIDSY